MKQCIFLAAAAAVALAVPASAQDARGHHHHTMSPTAAPKVFDVTVGSQQASTSAAINGFFPPVITIGKGDSIAFSVGSSEMHNVMFGFNKGAALPPFEIPSPADATVKGIVLNPEVMNPIPAGNATTFGGQGIIGSGIMSLDFHSKPWTVTFNSTGVFWGVCTVHGWSMSIQVHVVPPKDSAQVLTPGKVRKETQALLKLAQEQAKKAGARVLAQSRPSVPIPHQNGTQHFVFVGGSETIMAGKFKYDVDYNLFVPAVLKVSRGDQVTWLQSKLNMDVPHTVTFLNGHAQIAATVPAGPTKMPLKYFAINPVAAAPSAAVLAKTPYSPKSTALFNSGVMLPGSNFTLSIGTGAGVVGEVQYECILHLTQNMFGNLTIV